MSAHKNQHIPDWSFFFFFFFCFSFAPFLSFIFSLTGSSWLSESDPNKGSASDFLFFWPWRSWLRSSSAFLSFLMSCCSVCPSGRSRLGSVKLCLCFSFAFCCSLASNAWDRDSLEALSFSSSPRYLRATWQNWMSCYRFFTSIKAQQLLAHLVACDVWAIQFWWTSHARLFFTILDRWLTLLTLIRS